MAERDHWITLHAYEITLAHLSVSVNVDMRPDRITCSGVREAASHGEYYVAGDFGVESYIPFDVFSNYLRSDVDGGYIFQAHIQCRTSERRCCLLEHYFTFDEWYIIHTRVIRRYQEIQT